MKPQRRSVSICTKISGVWEPRVRKPNPRSRLNHFTTAPSQSLSGTTTTWVRCGNCDGRIAVEVGIREVVRRLPEIDQREVVLVRVFVDAGAPANDLFELDDGFDVLDLGMIHG